MIQAPRSLLAAWRIRSITFSQAKKNPEILTFVGLPDF
jgi:hypothetical protein